MLIKLEFLAKPSDNPRREGEFEILIPRHELGRDQWRDPRLNARLLIDGHIRN
jgi:hypothetical protein